MIRRICRTLPRLAAVAALLLLAPSVQADDIEPEPYVEEEVEPEPEPEVEAEEEEEPEIADEPDRNIEKVIDLIFVRPLYVARFVVGLPFFVFYPFTLASGYAEDVVGFLWTDPLDAAFKRPLGEPPGDF